MLSEGLLREQCEKGYTVRKGFSSKKEQVKYIYINIYKERLMRLLFYLLQAFM